MAIEVTTENPGSENPASENSNPTNPTSTVQDQRWVIGQWLVSRLWIWFGFFGIAPQLAAQSPDAIAIADLSSLIRWDSTHYLSIVASGYTYSGDNNIGTIAFFPLYPLLIKVGSAIGLTPLVAGFLISNLCFLAGLWVLHDWVKERHGPIAARWTIAAMAWLPWSMFGTVLYTEGLFILLSALTLRAFDRGRYGQAAICGALASAARMPGMMLVPALGWVAWRERRGLAAYGAALAAGLGTLGFALFCDLRFGDPLAFIKVQKAWHPAGMAYGEGWIKSLVQVTLGPQTWKAGHVVDWSYPIVMVLLALIGAWLWRSRHTLPTTRLIYGCCALGVVTWLVAGSPLLNLTMVVGGIVVLWRSRRQLCPVAAAYGACTVLLLLSTGRTISVERHLFALVPLSIAIGLVLERHPRWAVPLLSCSALPLMSLSIRFVQNLWAG
jgi:Gpi18-like mannosyltransferase